MTDPTPTPSPILDAIEKVYNGQWHCERAEEQAPGSWCFTFVDGRSRRKYAIPGVSDRHAVPVLRDMLAHAELRVDTEEAS